MSEFKSPEIYVSDREGVPKMVDAAWDAYVQATNTARAEADKLAGVDWASYLGSCATAQAVAAGLAKASQDAQEAVYEANVQGVAAQQVCAQGFESIDAEDYDKVHGINQTMAGWE